MRVIFWGGPNDGAEMAVPDGIKEFKVPINYETPAKFDGDWVPLTSDETSLVSSILGVGIYRLKPGYFVGHLQRFDWVPLTGWKETGWKETKYD